MNNKYIIAVIVVVIIIALIITFGFIRKSDNKSSSNNNQTISTETGFDEETGLYYIKDEETGEIISASTNEEDLEFYKEHPDYNPNPLRPRSTNLQDYLPNMSNMIIEE